MTAPRTYGLIAEFAGHEQLLAAAQRTRAAGYRRIEAYSPFPIEGLSEALGHKRVTVPMYVLIGGITGGLGGFFMQWWAMAVDYPLNIGGRPFNSWPAFIPITFELTILVAALAAVISMLALNRLPEPYHPVFNAPGFQRASTDKFFLCIETRDSRFDPTTTRQFLFGLGPDNVTEVLQ